MSKLLAWRWARQGLDGSLRGASAAEVLAQTGWSRSVGGAGPYLALFARAGLSREQVDGNVAALKIHELPSARGSTYVVPAEDFSLALRAGHGAPSAAEIAAAVKFLGVKQAELDQLGKAVLKALARKPLDPRELKSVLPEGAVRTLGEAGKKRGQMSTLPLALGALQNEGRIRRVPLDGRLDRQRYAYTPWKLAPLKLSEEEVDVELARRFFRWAGPATLPQFAWWAGLSQKAARAAVAPLQLVRLAGVSEPCSLDSSGAEYGDTLPAGDEQLLLPQDLAAFEKFKPPPKPQYALVGSIDNLTHLRRDAAALLAPEHAGRKLFTDDGPRAGGSLQDLPHHAILDRGQLIGLWDYDAAEQRIVWASFAKASPALVKEVERVEAFVTDQLGDARSFSLDSPESRGPRLAALKNLGTPT